MNEMRKLMEAISYHNDAEEAVEQLFADFSPDAILQAVAGEMAADIWGSIGDSIADTAKEEDYMRREAAKRVRRFQKHIFDAL